MTKTFRVQLNIIKKPYDRPVHFKVDGARFETADKTVKFNVNAKYNLDFTFRPPQLLESVSSYLLYLLHRRIFLGGGLALHTLDYGQSKTNFAHDLLSFGDRSPARVGVSYAFVSLCVCLSVLSKRKMT